MKAIDSWLAYWNAPNRIYVNRRHAEAHYATVFANLRPLLPAGADSVVLDWGCGEAHAAERVAGVSGSVLLYDAAERMRASAQQRFGGKPNIRVLDDAALAATPPASIDFIVVNSVIQYLSGEQFQQALGLFTRLLRPGGQLLLGDIIEPGTPMLRDVRNLLGFAWRNGFFVAALLGLLKTGTSGYRELRKRAGFATYTDEQIRSLLSAQGFAVERLPTNIGPSRHRRSYLATKA